MTNKSYTAFYPSRPYWAVSAIDFLSLSETNSFPKAMEEEVLLFEQNGYVIRVCRDGEISLRVDDIEESIQNKNPTSPIAVSVDLWGRYLELLNTFYLLLDCSVLEIQKFCYFNLHEITNRDAYRYALVDDKFSGGGIASESLSSKFQMLRHGVNMLAGVPIQANPEISMRQIITHESIEKAVQLFDKVIRINNFPALLSTLAKGVSEYKVGNYRASIVFSWFVIEAILNRMWANALVDLDKSIGGGLMRIDTKRMKSLTEKNFSIFHISNTLELLNILEYDLFKKIDDLRRVRNSIVHDGSFNPDFDKAAFALNTAKEMIEKVGDVKFQLNLAFSVSGI